MGFLTPWFFAGLLGVGLPIWLHLLRKHRSTPLPFSSLMFFEQHIQSSIKHRRLRYLILFALRTLLIILIVLAFAQPYVQQRVLPLTRTGEITVVAVDNSLSMRAGNRLNQARQAARSLIGGLHPGERGQVLAFGSRVQAMSEITDDHSTLEAGLNSVEPSDARTSYAELARSLRSISQAAHLPLEVHLYSDMQQTGMPANFNDLRLEPGIKLQVHPIESKAQPNFAVENVVAPRRVYESKNTRVLATIAGFDNQKATRRVTLLLNGRMVDSKTVDVPESGRASAEFLSLDVPYGLNRGEVRIDSGDSLPDDDTFFFSVERAEPRHALFVQDSQNPEALLYLKTALASSGQSAFVIDSVTPDQTANLAPSKYAFIVLSDVGSIPPGFENQAREYVRAGGSVLITLGKNSVARTRVPIVDLKTQGVAYAGRESERFLTAVSLDTSHPSILKDNRWDDVKFYQAIRVTPAGGRIAASLSDGTPLLIDQQIGEGHVLVFASTLDNIANDFPTHNSFVPFIEQTARYLGHLNDGPPSVAVGSFAELRDSKQKGAAVDVVDPKGKRVLSLEEATKAQNIQFTEGGFYEIRRPNAPNELVAVNADRRESDLTPVPQDTLSLWQNTAEGSPAAGGAVEGQQKPLSVWWYVMIVVLALAVAESLLGNRYLSVDKEAA